MHQVSASAAGKLYSEVLCQESSLESVAVNHDDKFTKEDVTLFNAWYKARDPRADVNGDGKLGTADKTAFQKAYDNELQYRETTGGP